jgi:hypothetical protein
MTTEQAEHAVAVGHESSLGVASLEASIAQLLRFVRLPSNDGSNAMIPWPCIVIDKLGNCNNIARQISAYNGISFHPLRRTILIAVGKILVEKNDTGVGQFVLLLGKAPPGNQRIACIYDSTELCDFYEHAFRVTEEMEHHYSFHEAMLWTHHYPDWSEHDEESTTTLAVVQPATTTITPAPSAKKSQGYTSQTPAKCHPENPAIETRGATTNLESSCLAADTPMTGGTPQGERITNAQLLPDSSAAPAPSVHPTEHADVNALLKEDDVEMCDDAVEHKGTGETTMHTNNDSVANSDQVVTPKSTKNKETAVPPSSDGSTGDRAVLVPISTETVWTFNDVKGYLSQAGFVFRKSLYCRPGMDPDKNGKAIEGVDYFTTQQAFRGHLCAHGMDDFYQWSKTARSKVDQWVRYHILDIPDTMKTIPVYKELQLMGVTKALKSMGFTHRWGGQLSTSGLWRFPAVSSDVPANTGFEKEYDLWTHIVRFGFPDGCNLVKEAQKLRLVDYLLTVGKDMTMVDTLYVAVLFGYWSTCLWSFTHPSASLLSQH